jgi:hypothetical protein
MKDPKGPVKSYKSPEELSKKHKVPLKSIMKQVKVGTKVEGEHTTSKSGARITALQHVDELPNYYSRLKKIEKVKEGNLHAWFSKSKSKDGKPGWVQSDGSPCANEPGETKTPKCFSSSKLASMSKSEVKSAVRRKRQQDPGQQQKTGAAKPTYVSTDNPEKKMKKEEFVLESDVKGKGSGKKDACYHKVKARFKVWPSAYASGALVKCRQKGAKNWGNKSEEVSVEKQYEEDTKYCLLCRKNEKKEECAWGPKMWDRYSIAKIHPANESVENFIDEGIGTSITKALGNPPLLSKRMKLKHALIAREISKTAEKNKKRKFSGKAANSQNESYILEDHKEIASGKKKDDEGYMAKIEFDQIERSISILRKLVKKPDQQLPAWVQSKITRAADFIDTAAEYMSSDEEVSEACWQGYKQVGMKKKGKKIVPNCVPANENNLLTFSEFMIEVAAWQRKEGKNREGGLNERGRKSYEKENPGSDLKAPSKKVGNPRRASFCARMSGMKKKLTSKKTANDPNSRINKSLRAWNC